MKPFGPFDVVGAGFFTPKVIYREIMNKYGSQLHKFAPQLWRKTHIITGDYDMDASIEFSDRKHPYINDKVAAHTVRGYGYRTNYRGYAMSGDD